MATYRLGNNIRVSVGETLIGGQQNCSLTMSSETAETTTKDSGMWAESEVTGLSWSVSCDGLIAVDDAAVAALEAAWKNAEKVQIQYGTADAYKMGDAIIESLEQNDAMKEKSTYTVSFVGVGELKDSSEA